MSESAFCFFLLEAGDRIAGFVALGFELLGSSDEFASFLVQPAKRIQVERGAALLRHFGKDIEMIPKIIQVMHGLGRIP